MNPLILHYEDLLWLRYYRAYPASLGGSPGTAVTCKMS